MVQVFSFLILLITASIHSRPHFTSTVNTSPGLEQDIPLQERQATMATGEPPTARDHPSKPTILEHNEQENEGTQLIQNISKDTDFLINVKIHNVKGNIEHLEIKIFPHFGATVSESVSEINIMVRDFMWDIKFIFTLLYLTFLTFCMVSYRAFIRHLESPIHHQPQSAARKKKKIGFLLHYQLKKEKKIGFKM